MIEKIHANGIAYRTDGAAERTTSDPGFQSLPSLVRTGQAWMKFTAPYRISRAFNTSAGSEATYTDVRLFADALLEANPRRLLWGSDWPHVMVKHRMPHDADLCDVLGDWVQSDNMRAQILVSNPAQLYGF